MEIGSIQSMIRDSFRKKTIHKYRINIKSCLQMNVVHVLRL